MTEEHETTAARVVREQRELLHRTVAGNHDTWQSGHGDFDWLAPRPSHFEGLCRRLLAEAVDLVEPFVLGAGAILVNIARPLLTGAPGTNGFSAGAGRPAVLRLPPTSPGGSTGSKLCVENTTRNFFNNIQLGCPALLSTGPEHISGTKVTFTPGALDVPPRRTRTVTVAVEIPADARRSSYVGVVSPVGYPGSRLLLQLDVI